jgi:hypothetical protein
MEYLIVIVVFLVIVVVYLCWRVQFLFRRVIGLGEVVKTHYTAESEILTEIKKTLEAE